MSERALSNNLKHLIKLHDGISILELAKKTCIPQPTLHHILNAETKKPRKQALEALAIFFSISIDQLLGIKPLPKIPNALKKNLKISTIPIISWDKIKNYSYKNNMEFTKEIILDRQIGQDSFAVLMQDTSMEPFIPENALLLFDSEKKSKDRDFVMAHLSRSDKICFNRLFIDGSEYYIKQDQKIHDAPLIKLKFPQDKIIAALIEVRLQF